MSGFVPAPLYKEILESVPIPCVDVVIEHKGKVLLVLRTNKPAQGEWWPPGGRILKGETNEQAAVRKVLQETGLHVSIVKQIGAYSTIFEDGPFSSLKTGVHTVNIAYLAHLTDPTQTVVMDAQSSEYGWFSIIPENAPAYTLQIIKDSGITLT